MTGARAPSAGSAMRLLTSCGLREGRLVRAVSAANEVWIGQRYVVKLGSGRFRDSLAHEASVIAALPDDVPRAEVIAGGHADGREWLVLNRMPGTTLAHTWGAIGPAARDRFVEDLALAMKALHAVPEPRRFANPWLDDALAPAGSIADAYHAPPHRYPALVAAASGLLPAAVLGDVGDTLAHLVTAFVGDREVLTHTDLHAGNLLVHEGRLSAVLDFEGARPAAADQELDALIRFSGDDPALGVLRPAEKALHTRHLSELVRRRYPALDAHPRRADRLTAYGLLWCLVQVHHLPPGDAALIAQLHALLARAL